MNRKISEEDIMENSADNVYIYGVEGNPENVG